MALKVVTMAEMRREVLLEAARTGGLPQRRSRRAAGPFERPAPQPCTYGPADRDLDLRAEKGPSPLGARRIEGELARRGVEAPAVSSIHQALRRNNLVASQPPRRPKATKRFQRDVSNDLWQIDATRVALATRKKAWVMDMLDDHTRYLLAAHAATAPTGDAAWDCFGDAASRYGLPRQVLSDNGLCFTGRLHGIEVEFERSLQDLGVQLINAGPYHPQTLGKVERFHKTLKLWLADEGPAEDLTHLQELLDGFRHHYNTERPHQGIDNVTPAERFDHEEPPFEAPLSTGVDEAGEPTYPARSIVRKVNPGGHLSYKDRSIGVGKRFVGGAREDRGAWRARAHLLGGGTDQGDRSRRHAQADGEYPEAEKGGESVRFCHIGIRNAVSHRYPERTSQCVSHSGIHSGGGTRRRPQVKLRSGVPRLHGP